MKVLLTSGIYFPDIGGPATYIPILARRLIENHHEPIVISLTESNITNRIPENWTTNFVNRNGFKPLRILKTIKIISQKLKQSDALFCNGLFLESTLANYMSKKPSVAKIVGDPVWERYTNKHHSEITIEKFDSEWRGISVFLQRKLIIWVLNRFDVVTTPSEGLAFLMKSWGVKKEILIIKNGVMCTEETHRSTEFDVISLTRLVSWKRVDLLIEACKKAKLSLAIAGDGPEKQKLEALSMKIGANVKFFGNVAQNEVNHFLSIGKIFALLSSYEGLSFSLIQAMMAGKRIVVSNAKGNLDVIQDGVTGKVVKDLSINNITEILLSLSLDSVDNSSLEANARKEAMKNYCAQNQLDLMIQQIILVQS